MKTSCQPKDLECSIFSIFFIPQYHRGRGAFFERPPFTSAPFQGFSPGPVESLALPPFFRETSPLPLLLGIFLTAGHPIIFLKKYGKYGNFLRKNMGGIWAILEFSWQNMAEIWEIWAIFNHFFHIFSHIFNHQNVISKKKRKKRSSKFNVNPMPSGNDLHDTEI